MLKQGDKIQVSRNGKTHFIDTVVKINEQGIAVTKNGQRFASRCDILKPFRGLNDSNYTYKKL